MTNDLVKRLRAIAVHSYLGRSVIEEAADRIEQLTAELADAEALIEAQAKDHASNNIRFAEAEHRAKTAEAERDRLRYERDAILLDGTVHSDQREKYERLCARIAAGKASQQDAVDAIRQLCRDNERLALRRSDARAALKGESHD